MKEDKPYLVFFSPQQGVKDKYHILLSGKETQVYVTKHDIMGILTATQFRDFVHEIGIYEVSRSRIEPYLKKIQRNEQRERWKPL